VTQLFIGGSNDARSGGPALARAGG